MKKTLCLLLIIGIAAVAVLTSGCTDSSSVIGDTSGGDGPEDFSPADHLSPDEEIGDNAAGDVLEGEDASGNDTAELEPVTSVYTENNSTSSVRAVKGDTIVIMLEEKPTTGYSWNLSADSGLALLDDQYVQDPAVEGMTGAGGVHNWTFEVTEEGVQNISAIYKRPWENITGDEDIFELTVEVVPGHTIIQAVGTVAYVDIEGGFYGIAGDDNTNYDPVNLGDEFRKDGLKVEFTAYPAEDMASFHMWGQFIELRSIRSAA